MTSSLRYSAMTAILLRLHLSGTGVKKCYTTAADLLTSARAGDASAVEYLEPIRRALEISALAGDVAGCSCGQ